jgi:hypothetical protein
VIDESEGECITGAVASPVATIKEIRVTLATRFQPHPSCFRNSAIASGHLKDLRGHGAITVTDINDAMRRSVWRCSKPCRLPGRKSFIARVKDKALVRRRGSVTPGQQIVQFSTMN